MAASVAEDHRREDAVVDEPIEVIDQLAGQVRILDANTGLDVAPKCGRREIRRSWARSSGWAWYSSGRAQRQWMQRFAA